MGDQGSLKTFALMKGKWISDHCELTTECDGAECTVRINDEILAVIASENEGEFVEEFQELVGKYQI